MQIAVREDEAITWLLSDHLNSTNVTVDATGNLLTALKYTAYGELRNGTSTTDYQYTGQRNEVEIGLYYYVARMYDPQLARFISADTIVPEAGNAKAYDRYAYVNGNPISFNDPSGHRIDDGCLLDGCEGNSNQITHTLYLGGFPFVLIPNEVQNYSQEAEEEFSTNEDSISTGLGVAGIVNDSLEQGLYYQRTHAINDVEAFISFNELENGSISITSLTLWNMTDTSINIDSISIQSFHIGTNPVMSTGEGYYSVNPPIIAEKGYKGAGTASPQCRSTISLLQSSPNNPNNIFSRNHHIDVGARFSAYDFNYTFLSVELVSFDW